MKSALSAAALIALAGVGLAGCNQKSGEPSAATSATAPDAPAGVSVAHGSLVLPAVKGNPGVVYFDITNNGAADTSIAGVHIDGVQSATLHMTMHSGGVSSMMEMSSLPVTAGATVKFAPGGNHVMATGLDDGLKAGGTTEVTLTFASGDKVSFPAKIEPAGTPR